MKPRGSIPDRLAGLYSLPSLNSPLPTDCAAATARLTLSPVSTHMILKWIPSRFFLQPSLLTPSFGISTRISKLPPSLNLLRWEAQKGSSLYHLPSDKPFWAKFIKYQALDIQAANGPSRSFKPGTGGPVCLWSHPVRPQLFSLCHVFYSTPSARGHARTTPNSTTTLVSSANWLCDGSPCIGREHLHTSSSGPLLKSL